MKIETIEIAGFAGALTALRLPFGKECRSTAYQVYGWYPMSLYGKETGDKKGGYNGFFTETYVVPDVRDLQLMTTLIKRGDEHAKVVRGINVWAKITAPVFFWTEAETYRAGHERLASESTMHIDCKGLSGKELQEAKAAIPMGKELTKVDMFSYQTLRRIVAQRHNHRLPEWHTFIDWIRTLPYAEELIFVGLNIDTDKPYESNRKD